MWSIDLFRCDSVGLKSHWVMVAVDLTTRSIVGTAVNPGNCTTTDYCRMFNDIRSKVRRQPKRISTDNDPLYSGQWIRNLSILEIDELKSIPGQPTSHPFVERCIGTIRRECLDQTLFFHPTDPQQKLDRYLDYFNNIRGHSSLDSATPFEASLQSQKTEKSVPDINHISWNSYCNGLFRLTST